MEMSGKWPVHYRRIEPEGTCYISPGEFYGLIEKHNRTGQAWKYRGTYSTYCPNREVTYKNIDRLAPDDELDFSHIMGSNLAAGLPPPSSFNRIFMNVCPQRFVRPTFQAPFKPASFGGWQQVIRPGEYRGRVWHYDLNKAYRWAACEGLPDLRACYRLTKDFDAAPAIFKVYCGENQIPYAPWPGVHIVTSEERDALGLKPEAVFYGIEFVRYLYFDEAFAEIDAKFPWCHDRISRAFWGAWNTYQGVEQVSWKNGNKSRIMKNPWYNPIWSAYITSRVKLRLLEHIKHSLHFFVDSILSTEEIETGSAIGQFRLKSTHDSIWVSAPGVWGEGDFAIKHSGYKEGGAEMRRLSLKRGEGNI